MDESEDNLSAEDIKYVNSPIIVKNKSKKKSLVERELETSLTARITSPIANWESSSTSRYGRARRLKTELESNELERSVTKVLRSPKFEKSPVRIQSPVYKMHASNSSVSMEKSNQIENKLETQIENIYNENISLSRFGSDEKKISPAKKFPKVYMRQDLIQSKEKDKEETITLIKSIFSPAKVSKPSTHVGNVFERSSDKYSFGTKHLDTSSVVKTLDFDGKKKKKEITESKVTLSKSEIFEMEAKCEYQFGDLAWARMGSYPFWPCIVTRDPACGTFVKKKLLGRIERNIIHVTFLGDNGRRGWIVENMLRKFHGQLEFETTRDNFTSEEKKRDPKLYAAFFISEKKQYQWAISVEEAEKLMREPKRLRIDIFRDMLDNVKSSKITPKIEKRVTRTNSDVSLSESLYDTLFSEDDTKNNDNERSKSKTRNKSLDVSEVVTACLDNMAAKTGNTKIQKQSHMDRWLQKAKSKTPEKSFFKSQTSMKTDKESKSSSTKKKSNMKWTKKSHNLRRSRRESHDVIEVKLLSHQNEHDYSKQIYGEIKSPVIIQEKANEGSKFNESKEILTEQKVTKSKENQDNHENNLVQNNLKSNDESVSSIFNDVDLNDKEVQDKLAEVNGESLPNNLVDEDIFNQGVEEYSYLEQNKDVVGISLEQNMSVDEETEVNDEDLMINCEEVVQKSDDITDLEDIQSDEINELEKNQVEIAQSDNDMNLTKISENQDLIENVFTPVDEDTVLAVEEIDDNQTSENQKSESEESEIESGDNESLKDHEQLRGNEVLQDNNDQQCNADVGKIRCNDFVKPNSFSSGYSSSIADDLDEDNLIHNVKEKEVPLNVKDSVKNNSMPTEKSSSCEGKCLSEVIKENDINIHTDKGEKYNDLSENEELNKDENLKPNLTNDLDNTSEVNKEKIASDEQSYKSSYSDVESMSSLNTEELCSNNLNDIKAEQNNDFNSASPLNTEEFSSNNPNLKIEQVNDVKVEQNNEMDFDESYTTNWKVREVIDDQNTLRLKLDRHVEKKPTKLIKELDDPEFLKYLELRQDALIDENPELSQEEITNYLYKTWQYEESSKSETKKTDEIEQAKLVKGLQPETTQPKRVKKKIKLDKEGTDADDFVLKPKSKRRTVRPYYNEDNSDIDLDNIELFEIFNNKSNFKDKNNTQLNIEESRNDANFLSDDDFDQVEEYFKQLTAPKPNLFKGLVREKVCDICEKTGNLVKCKGCHSMYHVECTKKETKVIDKQIPSRGRKKKKRNRGRKNKGLDDSNGLDPDSQSDEKSQELNVSEENLSIDDLESHIIVDAIDLEARLSDKMKEIIDTVENEYFSDSSVKELDWSDTEVGKCKIIDIKLPSKNLNSDINDSDFKCNNCVQYDKPVCFVCRADTSPKEGIVYRQRCQVAHCHRYYHLECLEHWPQTQFNSGEAGRNNKKIKGFFEPVVCPRHVCHTCVSDDPRGCKTRFSGDKLARCVRCPATYHTFTKCLPAGTQILTASHIICPRHYEHRPGKVPCHVNTGWCFICALGGSLICCEYCPTSFHAECLNIKPPEGGYMCEDCETGCLPLYGEMVWVKLGHYRWWPGIILHPSEIPANILAVKHSPGEFVVRFFGQYDHYWVNRGRVFPFQEGDTGKVSNQKSKIDAAFNMAMEHAQRACGILKKEAPNGEEPPDFASSLLPPHYVKLKVNKPCGSLCGRRIDLEEGSLTQCECNPDEEDPCGPYSQCLNRMLLTECGPSCRAGDRCNNRAFEKRLYPKLVPYRTPHRGWGLKTLEDIKAGQFVIEYVGELIDEEEFKRRMQRKYEIRDENYYFLTLDKERMIDAGPKGNLARFMNHCCEPNCETQKWTVLGDVRVGLFALRDIPANNEVTFNYNLQCAGIEKKRCLCGATRCSGYIGAKPKQSDPQPKKNKKEMTKRTYKKRKIVEYSPTIRTKTVKRQTSRSNPKELTEIEKDLLIIKQATNGMSSDSECSERISIDSGRESKASKRKRDGFSIDELNGISPSSKRFKEDD